MTSPRFAARLGRLINLVPYFQANPGISAADAARELGLTTAQVLDDLNQLWVCGLPGYGPGDLIDLSFSEESIEVTFSAGIDRPLRLTSTEATTLLIALRTLVDLPGTVDPSAAIRAIAKIEEAAGAAESPATAATTDHGDDAAESAAVAAVRSAVGAGRALRLTYYSASRDAVSDRIVDPIRLVLVDDRSYLQAWCRRAEGVRLFRLDRIDAAQMLPEPSAPPTEVAVGDALELFHDDASLPITRLLVDPDHAWILEYYPMTQVGVHSTGALEVTMRYATSDWMVRLLLGFGGSVTVLDPPELRESVARRARAALDAYRDGAH